MRRFLGPELQRYEMVTFETFPKIKMTRSINTLLKRKPTLQDRIKKFGNYELILPNLSIKHVAATVPNHITRPNYRYAGGISQDQNIVINTPEDINGIRKASSLARKVLQECALHCNPGTTTAAINEIAHNMIVNSNAYPSPLNYMGFPKSVCTSVNNVLCHGIPDDRPLKDGDIINVDITVYLDGLYF